MQMGVLHVGDEVTARLSADHENDGTGTVQVVFTPSKNVSEPRPPVAVGHCEAAAGGSCVTEPVVIPSSKGGVKVVATVPGTGTLEVLANGEVKTGPLPVSDVVEWDYVVVP